MALTKKTIRFDLQTNLLFFFVFKQFQTIVQWKWKKIRKIFYYFSWLEELETQFFYLDFPFLKLPSIWIFLDSLSF
jgi:hypothetical protein